MPNIFTDEVRKKAIELTGERFCTNCQMSKPKKGGLIKILEKGRNQRWICQSCTAKKIARINNSKAA